MTRVPGRPARAPSLLADPLMRELLDPENIGYRIAMLPQQIAEAWAISLPSASGLTEMLWPRTSVISSATTWRS